MRELLAEPLADELTRGGGMRFAALLHDAAKPATQGRRPDGRVTFVGHDAEGAQLARDVLRRLRGLAAARRLRRRAHPPPPAARLPRPRAPAVAPRGLALPERDRPDAADVTVFTVADRLATRGKNAEPAIAAHLELAREMLGPALARRAAAKPAPLVRGARARPRAGDRPGPEVGRLLAELEEAQYAGEIRTREDAISLARSLLP